MFVFCTSHHTSLQCYIHSTQLMRESTNTTVEVYQRGNEPKQCKYLLSSNHITDIAMLKLGANCPNSYDDIIGNMLCIVYHHLNINHSKNPKQGKLQNCFSLQ